MQKLCTAKAAFVVGPEGFEPSGCHSQSVVPYHLATAHRITSEGHVPKVSLSEKRNFNMGWVIGLEPTVFSATN